jgi:hypothetical protein
MVQPANKRLVTEAAQNTYAEPAGLSAGTKAGLGGTYAQVSRSGFSVANDRSAFSPGSSLTFAWSFLPLPEPGTHYGLCIIKDPGTGTFVIKALYSNGNLGYIYIAEPVFSIASDSVYDPALLVLPNGRVVMGCHGGDEGNIHFFTSDDQGSTWTARQIVSAGVATTTHRRFSEVNMIRVPLGSVYTGTSYRIVATWCDIDPVLPVSRDTRMVTSRSDDNGVTWSTPASVTPASGAGSAGMVNDQTRPWIYSDSASNLNLIYSSVVSNGTVAIASIWHMQLASDGITIVTAPVKIIDSVYAVSALSNPNHPGVSPAVFIGRDGLYHLIWAEANYANGGSDGVINMMAGDGTPGGWSGKQTLLRRADAPSGYGRVQPMRIGDSMEIIYAHVPTSTTSQMRTVTLAGL